MARFTVKNVRWAFTGFVAAADAAGFDTTGWLLEEGSSSCGISYRVYATRKGSTGRHNTPFGEMPLGCTAREAVQALWNMTKALYAVADMQRYGRGAKATD